MGLMGRIARAVSPGPTRPPAPAKSQPAVDTRKKPTGAAAPKQPPPPPSKQPEAAAPPPAAAAAITLEDGSTFLWLNAALTADEQVPI